MLKAPKHRHTGWAQNTGNNTVRYLSQYPKLTLSAFTIVEVVDGLKLKGLSAAIAQFLNQTLHQFEVIYPDQEIMALGGRLTPTWLR